VYCTVVVKVQKGVVPIHLWGFMDPLGVCVGGSKCRQEFPQRYKTESYAFVRVCATNKH